MSENTSKVGLRRCTVLLVSEKEGEKERWRYARGGVVGGTLEERMFKCVRSWWDAKIVSRSRTLSAFDLGGRTLCILIRRGGVPIELLRFCETLSTVVSTVERPKNSKAYGETSGVCQSCNRDIEREKLEGRR